MLGRVGWQAGKMPFRSGLKHDWDWQGAGLQAPSQHPACDGWLKGDAKEPLRRTGWLL